VCSTRDILDMKGEGRQDRQEAPGDREVSGSGEDPRRLPGSTEGAELMMDTRNFMILCLLSKIVI
jgi:hypothetical protein